MTKGKGRKDVEKEQLFGNQNNYFMFTCHHVQQQHTRAYFTVFVGIHTSGTRTQGTRTTKQLQGERRKSEEIHLRSSSFKSPYVRARDCITTDDAACAGARAAADTTRLLIAPTALRNANMSSKCQI